MDHKVINLKDGGRQWNKNNDIHRNVLPAIMNKWGVVVWMQYGYSDRSDTDLPTSYNIDGRFWYECMGVSHRTTGPQFIDIVDGDRKYFLDGREYSELEWMIYCVD